MMHHFKSLVNFWGYSNFWISFTYTLCIVSLIKIALQQNLLNYAFLCFITATHTAEFGQGKPTQQGICSICKVPPTKGKESLGNFGARVKPDQILNPHSFRIRKVRKFKHSIKCKDFSEAFQFGRAILKSIHVMPEKPT